jgi:hypothetical protein
MRSPVLLKTTSWLLLAFFPAVLNASVAQGVVQVQGSVTVNGRPVSNSTSVFAGDRIQTAAASSATLSSQGVMMQIQPDTTAIFNANSLDLGCGSATVSTSVGTMVRVGNIVATPASPNTTRIQVSQMNGTVKITARDNWAVVNDGHIRQTLAPGQSVTFTRPNLTCEVAIHTVGQASSKAYIPAAAVAVGLGVLTYCGVHGFCSEVSPAGP